MLHFVDVFRGSQSRAVRDSGHHTHKWAGAGTTMNRGDVERLFQHLTVREVFNERSEVNAMGFANAYLELGPAAEALFRDEIKVELSVQRPTAPVTATMQAATRRNAAGNNGSSNNNNGSTRALAPQARGRTDVDDDFEVEEEEEQAFDAWDISNMDLSPSPEPRRPAGGAGGAAGSALNGRPRGMLERSTSFEALHPRGLTRPSRNNAASGLAWAVPQGQQGGGGSRLNQTTNRDAVGRAMAIEIADDDEDDVVFDDENEDYFGGGGGGNGRQQQLQAPRRAVAPAVPRGRANANEQGSNSSRTAKRARASDPAPSSRNGGGGGGAGRGGGPSIAAMPLPTRIRAGPAKRASKF